MKWYTIIPEPNEMSDRLNTYDEIFNIIIIDSL